MNLRKPINSNIESFETLLINSFSFEKARPTNKKPVSGRFILHYLYFCNYNNEETMSFSQADWLPLSVFTDKYIDERQKQPFDDTDLFYYIMFIEPKIPSTLNPTLSNLVGKKEDSTTQPVPAVREMILNIDIQKLSAHFNTLIELQTDDQTTDKLADYISYIFEADSRIAGVCNEYCTQIPEQLAWTFIYALSNKECFDQYENAYRISLQSKDTPNTAKTQVIHSENDKKENNIKQKLIEKYKTLKTYNQVTTCIIFALSIFQMICLAVPLFSTIPQIRGWNSTLFYIVMLCFSIVLLFLRFIPFYFAKNSNKLKVILDFWEKDPSFRDYNHVKNLDLYAISYNIFNDTSYLHTSREKKRKIMNICVGVSCVFFFTFP